MPSQVRVESAHSVSANGISETQSSDPTPPNPRHNKNLFGEYLVSCDRLESGKISTSI